MICLGLSKQLPLVYRSLDFFYFPSVTEGQPNALIEAMLSGLPILASDIKPIKEALPPEMDSRLMAPLEIDAVVNTLSLSIDRTESSNTDSLKEWAVKPI